VDSNHRRALEAIDVDRVRVLGSSCSEDEALALDL
jgi:hypothetical protein